MRNALKWVDSWICPMGARWNLSWAQPWEWSLRTHFWRGQMRWCCMTDGMQSMPVLLFFLLMKAMSGGMSSTKLFSSASRSQSLVQALRFAHHVLGFDNALACADSKRVSGQAQIQLPVRTPGKQARPLTVDEVRALHAIADGRTHSKVDRCVASGLLFALYGRCRVSDLNFIHEILHDVSGGTGFIEVTTRHHKSARTVQQKSMLLPIVVSCAGVSQFPWVDSWIANRKACGLPTSGLVDGAMMPAPILGETLWIGWSGPCQQAKWQVYWKASSNVTMAAWAVTAWKRLHWAGLQKPKYHETKGGSLVAMPRQWRTQIPSTAETWALALWTLYRRSSTWCVLGRSVRTRPGRTTSRTRLELLAAHQPMWSCSLSLRPSWRRCNLPHQSWSRSSWPQQCRRRSRRQLRP